MTIIIKKPEMLIIITLTNRKLPFLFYQNIVIYNVSFCLFCSVYLTQKANYPYLNLTLWPAGYNYIPCYY